MREIWVEPTPRGVWVATARGFTLYNAGSQVASGASEEEVWRAATRYAAAASKRDDPIEVRLRNHNGEWTKHYRFPFPRGIEATTGASR